MDEIRANEKNKIHVLDFEVANLIAAGEVVDRPASVIKELLENAIDAGATVITTEIQHGGISYMRVTDNGCGIDFDDLPTAILRHATSKISSASDLDGIMTLGFRGEALAAIASVSKMRIISRPEYAEFGGLLSIEGGEIVEYTETGCSKGTNIIVEELFANVPARRKFLKKDASETAAICTIVERVALSRPDISFRLITDGVMRLRTEGNGDLKGAIYSVLGRGFWSRTIPVKAQSGGVSVEGYIGMPDTARANRNGQIFFINGRYIRSKTAQAAIEQAYNTFAPADRFPACVLSITVAPNTVDVNVHPAKLEVKFSNEKLIFETVYYAVRPALERNMTTAEIRLTEEKKSAVNVIPSDYMRRAEKTAAAFVPVRDGTPTPKTEEIRFRPEKESLASTDRPVLGNVTPPAERKGVYPLHSEGSPRANYANVTARMAEVIKIPEHIAAPTVAEEKYVTRPTEEVKTAKIPSGTAGEAKPENDNAPKDAVIPDYRIVGEAFNCYVIVEYEKTLLLIDKHAAHERILYERLRENMRQRSMESASQLLIVPVTVELTSDEAAAIAEYADEINAAGFDFTLDGSTVTVSSLPHNFGTDTVHEIFEVFADGLRTSAAEARDIIFERTLYTCACKAAIKGGRVYGPEHIKWLCDELFRLPNIKYCPHGRPVALELTHSGLDRHFKRTQ